MFTSVDESPVKAVPPNQKGNGNKIQLETGVGGRGGTEGGGERTGRCIVVQRIDIISDHDYTCD